jgi:16S rRNA (adenine1518-N6/adenine1519-N6)-dimethyltransferase
MRPAAPKKHLGQNFLNDAHIREKIIAACHPKPTDTVLEIGPGKGALTHLLAPLVKRLICVETDRDLVDLLRSKAGSSVEIIHADFLKWDMRDLPEDLLVVGNIPYYISTPIIEKLIRERSKYAEAFLTVQLEFGQRLTAPAGGKDYGSLSCFAQYYTDIKILFKIKGTCFYPVPKVNSCFLRLKGRPPIKKPLAGEDMLFKLIQTAFQQRRKTIVNSLKTLAGKEKLEPSLKKLGIDPRSRPESLNLLNYIELCDDLML